MTIALGLCVSVCQGQLIYEYQQVVSWVSSSLGKSGLCQLFQKRDLKIIASNTRLCTEQTASSLIKIRY
jgi:hypothetical protein